jgi:hypothetical protein
MEEFARYDDYDYLTSSCIGFLVPSLDYKPAGFYMDD